MLDSLITSKTRINLLLRFFLNPESKSYLREIAGELNESTNAVRVELNRMNKAGLLETEEALGRNKYYKANQRHPLFPEIQTIVRKSLGIDKLVEDILSRLGDVRLAFITGDYARGRDTGIIDLVIVGEEIDRAYLGDLTLLAEKKIGRKIRLLVLTGEEYDMMRGKFEKQGRLPIWGLPDW